MPPKEGSERNSPPSRATLVDEKSQAIFNHHKLFELLVPSSEAGAASPGCWPVLAGLRWSELCRAGDSPPASSSPLPGTLGLSSQVAGRGQAS